MIKAILLDLDNTLLVNPDSVFAPAYLQLADQFFGRSWTAHRFSQAMLSAMHAMTGARDMRQSNLQITLEIIERAVERSRDEINEATAAFYRDAYPNLKTYTKPVPGAAQLVETILEKGFALVIATNPIYPPEAIRQRLEWAGLPADFEAYAYVTHAGNMHFAKPDPAYYAEILARVSIEPDEAIMVGDRLDNDIRPARQIGLHTFHTANPAQSAEPSSSDRQTLQQFHALLTDATWLDSLTSSPLLPAGIAPQLRGNIGALFGMLEGIQPSYWTQHPDPNEWSILQIVCHLLESEETVQRPRLQRILSVDNPFLAESRQPAGAEAIPCDEDGDRAAQAFVEARLRTIAFLDGLHPEAWERPARHSVFGPTTLLELAQFTAQHDRLHLRQLCQTLGNCS